ncbi:copper resistance CopC family protein [Actinoplanes sp. NPDC051411]|uniref:copper resistance CopC family protein n=1 Tax=Actinoplanes sp. NPDC051411 TaxID=3155522 RepID=UPI00341A4D36
MTRRILALLAVVAVLLFGGAAPARADFQVLRSTPAAGSTVLKPPAEVQVTFDRPVSDVASSVRVSAPGGVYNDGVVTLSAGNTLVQPVRRMSSGDYTVSWTATAAPGAPATSGKFTFTVSAPAEPGAGPGQWIVLGVLAVIIAFLGNALIRRRLARRPEAEPGGRRPGARGRK